MEIIDYEIAAMRTAKDMGSPQMNLIHAALLIGSEGGELMTSIKAYAVYGKPLDKKNLIEEAGDLMWGIALLCKTLNISMEDVADANIEKLRLRYPQGYNDRDALLRWDKTEFGLKKHLKIPEEEFTLEVAPSSLAETAETSVVDNDENRKE